MTTISNHMQRDLILQRPYPKAEPGKLPPPIITNFGSRCIVIKPGQSADIDFWDAIQGHAMYRHMLDRGKISVGGSGGVDGTSEGAFTTFGDTLALPDSLNPEIDQEQADADPTKMSLAYGEDAQPGISSKRRGRKAKTVEAGSDGGESN